MQYNVCYILRFLFLVFYRIIIAKEELNVKVLSKIYNIPVLEVTATQLLEASKNVWTRTQNGKSIPTSYKSVRSFVKGINEKHGNVYEKTISGYTLTKNGKEWLDRELFFVYLNSKASLGNLIEATVSKINYLKKYNIFEISGFIK